jgi:hypothetical protein
MHLNGRNLCNPAKLLLVRVDWFSNPTMSSGYLTIAAVTAAVGMAAYAVYFDYKRRNDVEFRKRLSKFLF